MASIGKTFKRCGCRNSRGQRLEQDCPRLSERGHGSWYFHCSAPNLLGRSERVRRGGFASQTAARAARDVHLAHSAARRTGDGWTVERWLRHWLDTRTRIRPTTRLHYTRDVELVLIPRLGHYRLADLDGPLLRAVFAQIAQTKSLARIPVGVWLYWGDDFVPTRQVRRAMSTWIDDPRSSRKQATHAAREILLKLDNPTATAAARRDLLTTVADLAYTGNADFDRLDRAIRNVFDPTRARSARPSGTPPPP